MTKEIIKRIIGKYTYARVKRVANRLILKKKSILTEYPLDAISKMWHTSCGYYDHDPVYKGKLLYISTDSKMKNIVNHCVDLKSQNSIFSIDSHIANWQQGNRLFWIGNNRYIFNDFDGKNYISKEVKSGIVKSHPWPVYDANDKIAISVDFTRLGYLRPGYGYTKLSFQDIKDESTAISLYSLDDETEICKIKYIDILNKLNKKVDIGQCYINHVSISPKGNRFLFFFIERKQTFHMCYLGIWEAGNIRFIEKELSASHYTWRDNDTILITAYDSNRKCGYYLYDISRPDRINILKDKLIDDGHPTFISKTLFITDTYPDNAGFQRIEIVNLETQEIESLVEIYSTAKHMGVERCDLHPRYDTEKKIYFDADIDGHRRLYILNVEGQKWIKEKEKKGL